MSVMDGATDGYSAGVILSGIMQANAMLPLRNGGYAEECRNAE